MEMELPAPPLLAAIYKITQFLIKSKAIKYTQSPLGRIFVMSNNYRARAREEPPLLLTAAACPNFGPYTVYLGEPRASTPHAFAYCYYS